MSVAAAATALRSRAARWCWRLRWRCHRPARCGGGGPALSFHLDQPYLDHTGDGASLTGRQLACASRRDALAALSDMELSRFYGFI